MMVIRFSYFSFLFLFLAVLVFFLSYSNIDCLTIPPQSIPFITYGPNLTNPHAVQSLLAVYPLNAHCDSSISTSSCILFTNYSTLNIGLSYSSEIPSFPSYDVPAMFAFLCDFVNYRGGIKALDGTNYYLSITFTEDNEANDYVTLIYETLIQSQMFPLFTAPLTDELLITVEPLIKNQNITMLSFLNSNPNDFPAHIYPNLFSLSSTADISLQPVLTAINNQAKVYYTQVIQGIAKPVDTQPLSSHGFLTVCLFAASDTLINATYYGALTWIAKENALRLSQGAQESDLITIVAQGYWSADSTNNSINTVNSYATTINTYCPYDVDVMVLLGDSTSGLDVVTALETTRLRPKSATGLSMLNIDLGNDTQLTMASGWIMNTVSILPPIATIGPSNVFTGYLDFLTAYAIYYRDPNYPSISSLAYAIAVEVLLAAVANSTSLLPSDIRKAMLAMADKSDLFTSIFFDPDTGINVDTNVEIGQFLPNVMNYLNNTNPMLYPYNWPWTRIDVGDPIDSSQTTNAILVAAVICVLGAWVGQILVEQSIFVRHKGGLYSIWLLAVSLSVGVCAIWCSLFMQTTSLSTTIPGDTSSLSLSWSLDMALLALLPSVVLTWLALIVMMGDIRDSHADRIAAAPHKGRAYVVAQQLEEQNAIRKKKAALNNKQHFYHLLSSVSIRVIIGSLIMTAAILLTRVTLCYIWIQTASMIIAPWSWIVTIILDIIFMFISMLMFFHALRQRFVGVFLFAGTILMDWQITINGATFYLTANLTSTPADLYTFAIDSTAVSLISGIVAAIASFLFIGLQFSRMQLSRNGLAVLMASLEHLIHKQKAEIKADKQIIESLRTALDQYAKIIECINLVHPLPQEYSFAMAMMTTFQSYQLQIKQERTTNNDSDIHHSPFTSTTSLLSSPKLTIGMKLPDNQHEVGINSSSHLSSHTSKTTLDHQQQTLSKNHSKPATDNTTKSPISPNRLLSMTRMQQLIESATSTQIKPFRESEKECDANSSNNKNNNNKNNNHNNSDCNNKNNENGNDMRILVTKGNAVARILPEPFARHDRHSSANHPTPAGIMNTSLGSSLGHGIFISTSSHNKKTMKESSRMYEEDLMTALLAQIDHRDKMKTTAALLVPGSSSTANHRLSRTTSVDNNYTLFDSVAPLLGSNQKMLRPRVSASNGPPSDLVTCALPVCPTLRSILLHPVCIEILKSELMKIHSVENLVFYLHIQKYRAIHSIKLRKILAGFIYETFIQQDAEHQININTKQREFIQQAISSHNEETAGNVDLFKEVECEVFSLMETNVMKQFLSSPGYRLCCWLLRYLKITCFVTDAAGDENLSTSSSSDDDEYRRNSHHSSMSRA